MFRGAAALLRAVLVLRAVVHVAHASQIHRKPARQPHLKQHAVGSAKTGLELKPSGVIEKLPRHSNEAPPLVMRRASDDHGAAAIHAASLMEELQHKGTSKHGQAKAVEVPPAVQSGLETMMPRVRKSEMPFVVMVFLTGSGALVYMLVQRRKQAEKTGKQAALRQKLLVTRQMMAADGQPTFESKSGTNVDLLGKKGFTKGFGKQIAKGFGKEFGKGLGKDARKGLGKDTGKASGNDQGKMLPEAVEQLNQESQGSIQALKQSSPPYGKGSAMFPLAKGTKGAAQGKGDTAGASMVQTLITTLRAVTLIQSTWRRWKANNKGLAPGQRIKLVCNILEGSGMPNVNPLGGCDPFVECRIVQGDPTNRLRGDVDKKPLLSAQTDVMRCESAPVWKEGLTFDDVDYKEDLYVQLVLWDYNFTRNQPVGHVALRLDRALKVHSAKRPVRTLKIHPLPGSNVTQRLEATIAVQFFFSTCEEMTP